jgi:hypothetical protein
MTLEEAIPLLRSGKKIYRNLEQGYLKGDEHRPMGSFYLTLWDVLADDWKVE